ncbi:MAG: hypothetical protein AB1758_16135, partial [Candidatus Eremiobacterota bacterium]
MSFSPDVLAQAEVVLLGSNEQGAVLAYTPGETPVTLQVVMGAELEELMWCAQEMSLPLVDVSGSDGFQLKDLPVNEEIPEEAYRLVAQCLALVQRARPGPTPVRLVRPVGKVPSALKKRIGRRLDDLVRRLEVARLSVHLGRPVPDDLLECLAREARRLEL